MAQEETGGRIPAGRVRGFLRYSRRMDLRLDKGSPEPTAYFATSTNHEGFELWQEWQGSAFVRVRSGVRSLDGFRLTVLSERT